MNRFSIGRRELYILPTRHGWYYALILTALFGIAIKFDNQAAFMMLFILIAVGLVAMLYTHNNVINLAISSHPSKPVFVGDPATFPITIHNDSDKARSAVWLVSAGFHRLFNIQQSSIEKLAIQLPTRQRGYLVCDPVILTSQFPIGIFFVWSKRFQSQQQCLVYPQPLDLVSFQSQAQLQGEHENEQQPQAGSEDFAGLKAYQAGDRLRDIHWPSLAKSNQLISRAYEMESSSPMNFSWFSLPNRLSIEDKLSQLCFWVLEAEKQDLNYQLEMPNQTIEFNKGASHLHECLRTLALWGHEG